MKKLVLLTVLILALSASMAIGQNLVGNGSFEYGSAIPLSPGFLTVGTVLNAHAIDGWIVTSGTVDYIGNYWTASDGKRSIDLAGDGDGTIVDPFYTEASALYSLQFDLAGNPMGGPTVKQADVYINSILHSFTFDTTGFNTSNMGWTTKTVYFNGFDALTSIRFVNVGGGFCGAAIDNVIVQRAVPEASTLIGFGSALVMAGPGMIGWLRRRRS